MSPNIPRALLEEWMRQYYFTTELDIGSSGVQDFSVAELRRLLGLDFVDFDRLVLRDSQTLGGERLRQTIADRWAGGDPSQVMATHGSSEANFLLMNVLLAAGDEVVVTDPCYPQLFQIAEAKGCRLRKWPLRFERGFAPDLADARRLIGPRTRMIVANFPHNPTGATLTVEEQAELIAAAERVGAYLVWDNAFGEITYNQPPLPNPSQLYERGILMGTLSKNYGLPGLRVGWCIAAPEVLDQCARLRDYITLHLSPLVEMLAERAIAQIEVLVRPRLELARVNLQVVSKWMERHRDEIAWVAPQGGVCCFPRLLGDFDIEAFCRRLAREQKVLLVPGNCFGHDTHVRLGFGGQTHDLERGLERLGGTLALYRESGNPAVSPGCPAKERIDGASQAGRSGALQERNAGLQEELTRSGLSEEAARVRDLLGLPIRLLPVPRESTACALREDTLAVNRLIGGQVADQRCWSFLECHLPPELLVQVADSFKLRFDPLWSREELETLSHFELAGMTSEWLHRVRSRPGWAPVLQTIRPDLDFAGIWCSLTPGDFDFSSRGKDYTVGMEYFQAARSFGAESLMTLLGIDGKDGVFLDVLGGDGYLLRLQEATRKLREKRLLVVELPGVLADCAGAHLDGPVASDVAHRIASAAPGLVILALEQEDPRQVSKRRGVPRRAQLLAFCNGKLSSGGPFTASAEDLAELQGAQSVAWLVDGEARSLPQMLHHIAAHLDRTPGPTGRPMVVTNDISPHMFLSAGLWGLSTHEDACQLSRTFRHGSLDGVLFAYGTHHIGEFEKAVTESWAVLRPHGRIVVHDFLDEGQVGGWFHEVVDKYCSAGHPFPHLGPVELAITLLSAGFHDLELYEMEDPFIFGVPEGSGLDARDLAFNYLMRMYGMAENFGPHRQRFEDLVRERLAYPKIGNEPLFTQELVYIPRRAIVATARSPASDEEREYSGSDTALIATLSRLLAADPSQILSGHSVPASVASIWFGRDGSRWGLSPDRQKKWFRWIRELGEFRP